MSFYLALSQRFCIHVNFKVLPIIHILVEWNLEISGTKLACNVLDGRDKLIIISGFKAMDSQPLFQVSANCNSSNQSLHSLYNLRHTLRGLITSLKEVNHTSSPSECKNFLYSRSLSSLYIIESRSTRGDRSRTPAIFSPN